MSALFKTVYILGKRLDDGGITILSYHSIDEHSTGISVTPRHFEAQMLTLAAEGCPTFTMTQVGEHIRSKRPFPPRAVAVTFDDGFENIASVGAPIMARYGINSTIYVITGMVGRTTQWTANGTSLPPMPLMTWDQVKRLYASGIEIGAHTITHGFLTRYSPADVARELSEPKMILEEQLGASITSFAYPQGDYNPGIATAARQAGYTTAVTVDQGRASLGADPFQLPRLHVGNNTTPDILKGFTVPAAGPIYRLINVIIRGLMRRSTWPRPNPDLIQSTTSIETHPLLETEHV